MKKKFVVPVTTIITANPDKALLQTSFQKEGYKKGGSLFDTHSGNLGKENTTYGEDNDADKGGSSIWED